MTRRRVLYCCLALSCLSVAGIFVDRALAAPPPGELDITTVDVAGDSVPFVRLSVVSVGGPYNFRSMTDGSGHVLMTIPEGTYRIYAQGATGPPPVVFVDANGIIYLPTFVVIGADGVAKYYGPDVNAAARMVDKGLTR